MWRKRPHLMGGPGLQHLSKSGHSGRRPRLQRVRYFHRCQDQDPSRVEHQPGRVKLVRRRLGDYRPRLALDHDNTGRKLLQRHGKYVVPSKIILNQSILGDSCVLSRHPTNYM